MKGFFEGVQTFVTVIVLVVLAIAGLCLFLSLACGNGTNCFP